MIFAGSSLSITNLIFPRGSKILVLGPHPDDFDVISVTLRYLEKKGIPIFLTVATSGASGVEDSFCSPSTLGVKAKLREEEQKASCQFFGLPENNLVFLRLEEDEAGHPLVNSTNFSIIQNNFLTINPTIVFLPYSNDTNPGHQRIYGMFHQIAQEAQKPLVAFLNRDPKTIQMLCDIYTGYEETIAAWKGKLLRYHKSQHQRNLNHRGYGFDERILNMDRENARLCSLDLSYAEIFELAFFGGCTLEDFVEDGFGISTR
jgi:LmbE family N-acetylglucosaminyl deacetylase